MSCGDERNGVGWAPEVSMEGVETSASQAQMSEVREARRDFVRDDQVNLSHSGSCWGQADHLKGGG